MTATVSREQFFSAIADMANLETFSQAVSADKNTTAWDQYNSATCISSTDDIALLVRTTFNWTQLQLDSLFTLAATLPGGDVACGAAVTPATVATVSRQQFFAAIAIQANVELLSQAVTANKNDTLWIQFNSAVCISITDQLALLAQTTFGWTDAQLVSLFALADTLPGGNASCSVQPVDPIYPTPFGGATFTALDIINLAYKDAGVLGVGQSLLAEDVNDALTRLNMMIAQWRMKRWLVWHLVDKSVVSTGAQSYTVGPGGDINVAARPDKIESAFFRMLPGGSGTQAVDYPLQILFSMEDYARITLKQLVSFSQCIFYDSAWPLGRIYPWPIPQANLYEVHILLKDVLTEFNNLTSPFIFPPEYLAAIHYNLVVRTRAAYRLPPDPTYEGLAADALQTIRSANAQIPSLVMPDNLVRPSVYNIYSDQTR